MKIQWWRALHGFIILLFTTEILYGFFMVFFVVGGGRYPLFMHATRIPIEVILKRRLYGIEVWVAIAGLSVYLALTELLPRKLPDLIKQVRETSRG
jgi:hypothetical protein